MIGMSQIRKRLIYGQTQMNPPSRFLDEIDEIEYAYHITENVYEIATDLKYFNMFSNSFSSVSVKSFAIG